MSRKWLWPLLILLCAGMACESGAGGNTAAPSLTPASADVTLPPIAAGTPPPTAPRRLAIAYTEIDRLFFFALDADGSAADTPAVIAAGNGLNSPLISPDGSLVAYTVLAGEGVVQLWVVGSNGAGQRRLVGTDQLISSKDNVILSPLRFAWRAGTHILLFDTTYMPVDGELGPGEYINADLWAVDADSGAVTQLQPEYSVGQFFVSPNGQLVAISRPTGIDLVSADSSNRRTDLIAFPFINTYSEYAYKPAAVWSPDSAFFSVAIPSPDPLADDSSATFYRVHAEGTVQLLGQAAGNFVFGSDPPPTFTPDGRRVIYGQMTAAEAATLHLVDADGSNNRVIDRAPEPFMLSGLGWSPGSRFYLYVQRQFVNDGVQDDLKLAEAEGSVRLLLAGAGGPVSARWLNDHSFILLGTVNGRWGLYYQKVDGSPSLLASASASTMFDVRP